MIAALLAASRECVPADKVYPKVHPAFEDCLPYTGSDVLLYVLAGIVLVAFGVTLWAATRERNDG